MRLLSPITFFPYSLTLENNLFPGIFSRVFSLPVWMYNLYLFQNINLLLGMFFYDSFDVMPIVFTAFINSRINIIIIFIATIIITLSLVLFFFFSKNWFKSIHIIYWVRAFLYLYWYNSIKSSWKVTNVFNLTYLYQPVDIYHSLHAGALLLLIIVVSMRVFPTQGISLSEFSLLSPLPPLSLPPPPSLPPTSQKFAYFPTRENLPPNFHSSSAKCSFPLSINNSCVKLI